MKKLTYLLGAITTMTWLTGWSFSLMHLPLGLEMSFFGFMAFSILFLPMLAVQNYKALTRQTRAERMKYIFGIAGALLFAACSVFKQFHLQGTTELLWMSTFVLVGGFLPFYFFSLYKKAAIA